MAGETSLLPRAATSAAATAIATADGNRVTSGLLPATRTSGHMMT